MLVKKLKKKQLVFILIIIILLGFFLRIYRINTNNLIEEENTTVKAAAYLYYCQLNPANCLQSTNKTDLKFTNKLLVTLTGNETKPNLFIENYLWDWLKKTPTTIHYSRAWPHLYAVAASFKIFGISEAASRIASVIAGTLLIPVSFYFARYFLGSVKLSLLYSFLISTSFYFIEFSRHNRMYASFILTFQLLVYLIHKIIGKKTKPTLLLLLTFILFFFTFSLHLLTLILPVAVFLYSLFYQRKLSLGLLLSLILLYFLSSYFNIDFFHSYFSSWQFPPHWQYFKFIFSYPLPFFLSLIIILLNLPKLLKNKKSAFLLSIIIVNLFYLVFFSKMPPASAYTIHLLPIILWLVLLTLDRLLKSRLSRLLVFSCLVIISFSKLILNHPHLYLGKNNQPQPSITYPAIIDKYRSGDQILGIQIRDFYLKDLPSNTTVINLPEKQSLSLEEFKNLLNQTERSFIVFEAEKTAHLKPEVIEYIKANFQKLAGQGIDNYQVEIYFYQK